MYEKLKRWGAWRKNKILSKRYAKFSRRDGVAKNEVIKNILIWVPLFIFWLTQFTFVVYLERIDKRALFNESNISPAIYFYIAIFPFFLLFFIRNEFVYLISRFSLAKKNDDNFCYFLVCLALYLATIFFSALIMLSQVLDISNNFSIFICCSVFLLFGIYFWFNSIFVFNKMRISVIFTKLIVLLILSVLILNNTIIYHLNKTIFYSTDIVKYDVLTPYNSSERGDFDSNSEWFFIKDSIKGAIKEKQKYYESHVKESDGSLFVRFGVIYDYGRVLVLCPNLSPDNNMIKDFSDRYQYVDKKLFLKYQIDNICIQVNSSDVVPVGKCGSNGLQCGIWNSLGFALEFVKWFHYLQFFEK